MLYQDEKKDGAESEREITVTDVPFFRDLIFRSIDYCSEHAKLLVFAGSEVWHKLIRQAQAVEAEARLLLPICTFPMLRK